ncbi:hypothetical protein DRW41_07380 [Neobacillus piezotolerans]|nr:hypothetical protein DRW41_07380 [Neobacillus piezotolerans]
MKQDGKGLKSINKAIVEKYSSYGEGTPTPVPAD